MTQAAADALTAEGNSLFLDQAFAEAAARFERATTIFPSHSQAWKGLGHALLSLGRPGDAARAFDRAIGLRGESATALWGGALAHAELGHHPIAQNYLRRTLALQPNWLEMAQSVASLKPYLALAVQAADALRKLWGSYSSKKFLHADDSGKTLEVARFTDRPALGIHTYASIGFCDWVWLDDNRPRFEVVLASNADAEVSGQIVASAVFHLMEAMQYPSPGTTLLGAVQVLNAAGLSTRLPHLYFTVPWLWKLTLPLADGPPAITLTQAVPISTAEQELLVEVGPHEFERYLAGASVAVGDLSRTSVL